MKNYEKPIVSNTGLSEGVYLASGCYITNATIVQRPEIGRDDYRIQVNAKHTSDHTKDIQILNINFNIPVEYVSSNGRLIDGNGTANLRIKLNYHQNPNDNIGFGDLIVKANGDLAIINANITD